MLCYLPLAERHPWRLMISPSKVALLLSQSKSKLVDGVDGLEDIDPSRDSIAQSVHKPRWLRAQRPEDAECAVEIAIILDFTF